MNALPLDGRVAVVTGGGRGIGRAIAVGFAEAGADVCVIGRSADVLESAVAEIEGLGRRGLALAADLLEVARIPELFAPVQDELGGIDILVNSAGVQITGPSLEV